MFPYLTSCCYSSGLWFKTKNQCIRLSDWIEFWIIIMKKIYINRAPKLISNFWGDCKVKLFYKKSRLIIVNKIVRLFHFRLNWCLVLLFGLFRPNLTWTSDLIWNVGFGIFVEPDFTVGSQHIHFMYVSRAPSRKSNRYFNPCDLCIK